MNSEVRTYYESGSEEQKKLFTRLEKLILSLYPRSEVGIAYGVPTYGKKPGRVGLGYWKEGVSFYPYSGSALDEFRRDHPAIKTTKGSVNFRVGERIPVAAMKKLIKAGMTRRPSR